MSTTNPNFFPIPASVAGLWELTGGRDRLGRPIQRRNVTRWQEIAKEREVSNRIASTWRDAAIADGWNASPTYASEDTTRAATLTIMLNGGIFRVQIVTRPNEGDPTDPEAKTTLGGGEINAWGPDKLQIRVPLIYPDMTYFINALVTCPNCYRGPNAKYFLPELGEFLIRAKETPVPTQGYSFAGRTCKECGPEMARLHEKPGWND